jgi:cellobiose-specific phosphotransferase system component IIC
MITWTKIKSIFSLRLLGGSALLIITPHMVEWIGYAETIWNLPKDLNAIFAWCVQHTFWVQTLFIVTGIAVILWDQRSRNDKRYLNAASVNSLIDAKINPLSTASADSVAATNVLATLTYLER